VRIAKFLAQAGICSRREAEKLIQAGEITIDNKTITEPAIKVSPENVVKYKNKVISHQHNVRLWLFHKPAGYLVTNKDDRDRAIIFDILPKSLPRVITIGRLDYNSEGLLLLTNNGDFARKLELPINKFARTYKVRIFGEISKEHLAILSKGVTIEKINYQPFKIKIINISQNSWLEVTIFEGKNREIRKVFSHLGYQVNRLIRISYGKHNLDNLKQGEIQEINIEEI
jgi:23S rRNA pseudouridine2605 synthase